MYLSSKQIELIFEYIYGGIPTDKEWALNTVQYKLVFNDVIYYSNKLKYYFKDGVNILEDNGLFVVIQIKDKLIIPFFDKYWDKELKYNCRLYDKQLNKL